MTATPQTRKIPQLPSIVWVFIIVLGVVGLIGGIIFSFVALATVEGVASIVLLIAAIPVIWSTTNEKVSQSTQGDSIFKALGISFFAIMGMAIDQTGNYLYNLPFQLFCPVETILRRGVDISHPLPGRTDITQEFICFDAAGKAVLTLSPLHLIAVRFVEYLLLGYVLFFLISMIKKLRHSYSSAAPFSSSRVN